MPDPHWTSYVGMATGIAGAIMGFVSYRKSSQIKKLDLRIELRRAATDIHFDYKELLRKMEKGNKSRQAVAPAINAFNSGMMKKWNEDYESDQTVTKEIAKELPDDGINYDHLDDKGLEAKLIEIHRISKKIQTISERYVEAMAWDDQQRLQLREDRRSKSTR
jgi:hypothetical protein